MNFYVVFKDVFNCNTKLTCLAFICIYSDEPITYQEPDQSFPSQGRHRLALGIIISLAPMGSHEGLWEDLGSHSPESSRVRSQRVDPLVMPRQKETSAPGSQSVLQNM